MNSPDVPARGPAALPSMPLAALLERSRDELVERWKARVLGDPAVPDANALSEPLLRDHVPALLERLTERLRAGCGDGESDGPASGAVVLGAAHAKERSEAGYSVSEALRELAHLRASILDLCREQGLSLHPAEAQVLHATLDEVMTASAAELERASLGSYQRAMAIVAHELRNPLNAIVGASAWLQHPSMDRSAYAVEVLGRNAARMERLIADLLTVSKLEAGHFTISPSDVDARGIVHDTFDQLGALAVARGVTLDAHCPTEPLLLHCDRDRIAQALGNLVANALKFTPRGGRVDVTLEGDTEHCTFRVSDTGKGIAESDAAVIFQPFWQAPETRNQGTGLGLAIARGIVLAHGGTIALESRGGAGAVFAFTLPRRRRASFAPCRLP